VLSGFYASIGIYGHQDFSYAQLARADGMLEEMGAGSLKDRRFGAMSTGEQRRCLLGRARVHEPTALVLDEPYPRDSAGSRASRALEARENSTRWGQTRCPYGIQP